MKIEDILKSRFQLVQEQNKFKPKRGDYRSDMIKEIMDNVNKERIGTKFTKLSYIAIKKKVDHLDDSAVAYTLSICKDSKNRTGSFSKCFFGCLKVK